VQLLFSTVSTSTKSRSTLMAGDKLSPAETALVLIEFQVIDLSLFEV